MTVPLFGHEQEVATSDDYYTPSWVFEEMGVEFDLDVAAPPGGVPWIPAKRFYTKADDGLAQPWEGRAWMNPPFSEGGRWARRLVEHGNGVALLPWSKSPWTTLVWERADALAVRNPFDFAGGSIFLPTYFAGFGEWTLEPLSRIGHVR